MNEKILAHFEEAGQILDQFIADPKNIAAVESAGMLMSEAIKNGGKIISCGNGGSHCDAMHFAEELTGRYRGNRNPIPAIAISDSGYLTCVANDFGYDQVFSRFVQGMGKSGDVLLVITTSGNSENCILAAQRAKEMGLKVIALTGKDGGRIAGIADIEIRAPHSQYADRAQEIHIKVIHSLIDYIENKAIQ